jgi:hypothetical protein
MTQPIYRTALQPLVEAFTAIGVAYHIGGSVASMAHGVTRTTLDVDIVADLRQEHIGQLVERLQSDYYIDEDMIEGAVRDRSSFNLVHLPTMFKLDVFVLKWDPYDQQAFLRADLRTLEDNPEAPLFFVESAEDVVLNKLRWYRMGGEVSERQWNDLLGVVRVQAGALDREYLHRWASELGVSDLLERAMTEADSER